MSSSHTGAGSKRDRERDRERDRDRDRDDDGDNEPLPFTNLDKSAVIQQSRHFNDTPLSTSTCREVLSKLLYLFAQGDQHITRSEATQVFFNAVKLFQSHDIVLRRLLYIILKELAPFAEDILISVNSLAKDVNGKNEIYRAAAIRTLMQIADPSMLGPIERYMKQAVVDRSALVASAALVSGMKLMASASGGPDIVRRWIGEVQEAALPSSSSSVSSSSASGSSSSSSSSTARSGQMVQYHALALLQSIKSPDRMGVQKMVSQAVRTVRSPVAHIILIRYVAQQLHILASGSSALATSSGSGQWILAASQNPSIPPLHILSSSSSSPSFAPVFSVGNTASEVLSMSSNNATIRELMTYLDSSLRSKSEMVSLEAARAITTLPNVSPRELTAALTVLQLFLSSGRPVLRFAAIRTLEAAALRYPSAVQASCASDMEQLVHDPNRSIATFAVTTLLKIGGGAGASEGQLDRLLAQMAHLIGDLSDEFRLVVVHALRELVSRQPARARAVISFLAGFLHDEGGFEYKRAIVDTILDVLERESAAQIQAQQDALQNNGGQSPQTDSNSLLERALLVLCEFIEDCEYPLLSQQVLHVLGREAPHAPQPSRFVRYMYNRLILENASVRAAAMSALGKFALATDDAVLRRSIVHMLSRALSDADDEVRDRAVVLLEAVRSLQRERNELESEKENEIPVDDTSGKALRDAMTKDFRVPLGVLEKALLDQRKRLAEGEDFSEEQKSATVLDGTDVRSLLHDHVTMEMVAVGPASNAGFQNGPQVSAGSGVAGSKSQTQTSGAASVAAALVAKRQLPGALSSLGLVACTSAMSLLTESGTEYQVAVVKHVLASGTHLVLQFVCRNTVDVLLLAHVAVQTSFTSGNGKWQVESLVRVPQLPFRGDESPIASFLSTAVVPADGHAVSTLVQLQQRLLEDPQIVGSSAFVVLRKAAGGSGSPMVDEDIESYSMNIACTLQFRVKDADASEDDDGDDDEYPLNALEVSVGDFLTPFSSVSSAAQAAKNTEGWVEERASLELSSMRSVAEAARGIRDLYAGLCVVPANAITSIQTATKKHEFRMTGFFLAHVPIDVTAVLVLDQSSNVPVLDISIRSPRRDVTDLLLAAIA
eukprot:ANDGO_00647.mRNA.1 Coatomer subunit gamma